MRHKKRGQHLLSVPESSSLRERISAVPLCYNCCMKIHHRVLFRFSLLFGIFGTLFIIYLNVGLFPGPLKDKAVRKVEELTQRKVSFDRILYLPFRGLSFENLKVMQPNG